jgi:hypothetical protein
MLAHNPESDRVLSAGWIRSDSLSDSLTWEYQFQYHELAKIRFRPVLSGPVRPVPTQMCRSKDHGSRIE